jgi:DNA helicase II / ATP-dependent DNA helicase PcrA
VNTQAAESNITLDNGVEAELASFLDLENPISFFLFAGAGSGKTRSLVQALMDL